MNVQTRRLLQDADLDCYDDFYAAEARQSLWAFRQYVDPNMLKGWWVQELSRELQIFYDDLIAGKRPKLVIEAPPQHGKTRGLQDFIAWVAGKAPHLRCIYGSYSDDLGISTNLYLQRMFEDRTKYGKVFPNTLINATNVVTITGRWLRNSSVLEFVNQKGSFRNVTVQGQVTGKGLDFGVIDDPLKGRAEAQSKTIRDKTWNWLMDDYFNRFSEYAGLITIMTRWHVDDPVGRFIEHFPRCKVLKYPAMAVKGPIKGNSARDPRKEGEPLFPQFKSLQFLNERKAAYTQASWESLYQQSPIVVGGGLFPIEKLKYSKVRPAKEDIKKSVRYWDKAGTQDGGAYTAGVLMHLLHDGRFCIENVVRGQWGALERENKIKATAQLDATHIERVEIWVEQEPGSGGKESAERSITMLAGYNIRADKVTGGSGSKEVRADPYAAQFQAGNVILFMADWNVNFVDEHETFPTGKYKDQVDAAAGAFNKLVSKTYKYDASLAWVKGGV